MKGENLEKQGPPLIRTEINESPHVLIHIFTSSPVMFRAHG